MKRTLNLLSSMFVTFLVVSLFLAPTPLRAQNVSGMTGEVTDPSGAVVPSVNVTLTNSATSLKFTTTTNSSGLYRFANIPPGPGYEATLARSGFATVDIKDIYLTVSNVRTQDVKLTVASTEVHVEVTASNSEVTLDTTGASVGNTFDVTKLNDLPVQQRNDPTALFAMQPGVTDVASVTGARTDQNDVTLDGLDVNDFATGGSVQNNAGVSQGFVVVGHAPVDSLDELHAGVAGSGASANPGGGGQFELVTKSGTNQFHGALYEYHRDPDLVANTWFGNNSNPIVPRNHLIQNQFGGSVGGPVLKNKLFFFFDYNNSRVISQLFVQRTVPLDSLRAGNIAYTNSSKTVSLLTPAQVKALDPAGTGEDTTWLSAVDARFPHSNNSVSGDGVNSGGFGFNAPNTNIETNWVGRGDYNLNANMKIFARFTIARQNAVNQPNEFQSDPVISNPQVDRSYAFVVGHNWVIGSNKTNRVWLGETVQKLSFPQNLNPSGSTFYTFGDGADQALASSFYHDPNSQARRIPIPVLGDNFAWTKGNHTWEMGGTFKDIGTHNTTVTDYNTAYIGLGGQILGLCGPAAGACGTGNPSLRPSDISSGSTQNTNYDEAFAFMLARVGEVMSTYNYDATGKSLPQLTGDQRFYRYYETELFGSDSWKVKPSFTINYGLTYQLFSVPYETHGLETTEVMSLDAYMKARISQSELGESGPGAVPFITYVLAGKAANGPPIYGPQHLNLAPHFGFNWNPDFDRKMVVNGGVGVVYDRTIINAVQAQQDADSYIFQQPSTTAEGISGDPYDSIKSDPRLDSNNALSNVGLVAPATPRPPYQPFIDSNGNPFGLQNGGDFNASIDPALKTPYSIAFNGGLQRSLPGDMVVKVSYVGRLGRRLLAQVDANQVLDFPDPASGEFLSTAFAAMTTQIRMNPDYHALTPQAWMEHVYQPGRGASHGYANNTQYLGAALGTLIANGDFGDFVQALSAHTPYDVGSAAQFSENTFYTNSGFSSYNGLLLTLQKNLSHGLQFDLNYTFSHSIDNISFFANSAGDTGIGAIGLVSDDIRPRKCRAASDFDVRHYITADASYALPFGKGKMFFNTDSLLANEFIGGWALSGVTIWHTGYPWSNCSNAFVASYSNNAPAVFVGANKKVINTGINKLPGGGVNVFQNNLAASAGYVGPTGFAIGPRNSLRGPGFFDADLGFSKTFPVYAERVNLKFRADAFNAFNHPSFALPQENVYNGFDQMDYQNISPSAPGAGFGQISTTAGGGNGNSGARVLQVALRLEF